ncbi:scabrous protein [Anopheles darlingi]|uniref:Scabrous protein n=1 Tax=Anopheles darlingi TaxID=43151 RepID=W5JUA4_ANODA|nr:scabrous protein [Anopheles darlingi]
MTGTGFHDILLLRLSNRAIHGHCRTMCNHQSQQSSQRRRQYSQPFCCIDATSSSGPLFASRDILEILEAADHLHLEWMQDITFYRALSASRGPSRGAFQVRLYGGGCSEPSLCLFAAMVQGCLANQHTETSVGDTDEASPGPAGQLPSTIDFVVEPEADHRMRHQRFIRQQLHELEVKQSVLKRQLNELHGHRLADRLRSVEVEQRRLASAGFNVSRQVASLDKLHGSMLELLEDVEAMQTKFDKTVPDLRREIAKVEYSVAQVVSEQGLVREEVHNTARSVQAMAVSVSALQEERSTVRQLQTELRALKEDVARVRSATQLHREMAHNRLEKCWRLTLEPTTVHSKAIGGRGLEADSKPTEGNGTGPAHHLTELERTTKLVQQLETVEAEYESILNKLPRDCSQIEQLRGAGQSDQAGDGGLYLIAPAEQHHPMMTQCFGEWTTVQRRQDGSVDFNRSWEEYAQGFGTPAGEFWIGNEPLHHLTQDNCSRLRIIMQDIYDNHWHADYATFRIGSRQAGFRLELGGYSGNASDAFEYQNRMQFSAIDVDRDISNTHCAGNYEGGWWFSHCQHANLNGRYNLGLTWFDASRNEWIAVKSSHMMIARRPDCGPVETTTTTTTTTTARTTTSGVTTTAIPGTTGSNSIRRQVTQSITTEDSNKDKEGKNEQKRE